MVTLIWHMPAVLLKRVVLSSQPLLFSPVPLSHADITILSVQFSFSWISSLIWSTARPQHRSAGTGQGAEQVGEEDTVPAEIYARFNDPIIVLLQLFPTPLSKLNVGCKTEVREQKGSLQNLMWVLYLKHQVINNVWCIEMSVTLWPD